MSLETAPVAIKSAPAPSAPAASEWSGPQMRQTSFLEKMFRPNHQRWWSDETKEEKKEEKKPTVVTSKQTQKLDATLDDGPTEKQKKKEQDRVIHRLSTTALTLMKSSKDPNQAENVRCEIVQKLWEQYLESIKRNA